MNRRLAKKSMNSNRRGGVGSRWHLGLILGGWVVAVTSAGGAEGPNYLGAAKVLQLAAERAAAAPIAPPAGETNALTAWRAERKAFADQAANLTPEAAAQGWLALLEHWRNLPGASRFGSMGAPAEQPGFAEVMEALPGPGSWEALAKLVRERPPGVKEAAVADAALRLLTDTLLGRRADQAATIKSLEKLAVKAEAPETSMLTMRVRGLATEFRQSGDDPEEVIRSLEAQFKGPGNDIGGTMVMVPNLVALVGTNEAARVLRLGLKSRAVHLNFIAGEQTQALARQLAREMVQELPAAPWELANSLDASDLYEALVAKFGPPGGKAPTDDDDAAAIPPGLGMGGQDWQAKQAQTYYIFGLVLKGRTAEAVALARKVFTAKTDNTTGWALQQLTHSGQARALNSFFHEFLPQQPNASFWEAYLGVAAQAGAGREMLGDLRQALARTDLGAERRRELTGLLAQALLAADEVEAGVAALQSSLTATNGNTAAPGPWDRSASGAEDRLAKALQLARLGRLLQHPDWEAEGVRAARQVFAPGRRPADPANFGMKGQQEVYDLAGFLAETGRGAEAEELLLGQLAEQLTAGAPSADGYEICNFGVDGFTSNNPRGKLLLGLAQLYHHAGREAEVLTLLDTAPYWGVRDAAAFFAEPAPLPLFHPAHGSGGDTGGLLAAAALVHARHTNEARRVIGVLIDCDGSFDPAYELLLQLGGDDVLARLDAWAARDPFEARPLIWKARVLREAGRLAEAEAAARKAIAIDPSDGEQGPGRRLRAYAELAAIREAQGDAAEAKNYRGAVEAIRLAETADRFREAGLLSRAVKMYEESLNHFADAYCIHSRLAVELMELGRPEAAAAHYRRAYELMPDSFGRVESHCFGCEGVFKGTPAQGIAEKVFSDLVAKTPQKPQLHYLLGYLHKEQGRWHEALPDFREAVRLDPEYLNAWKLLGECAEQLHLPAEQRDSIIGNIWRLAPHDRHCRPSVREVADLRSFWPRLVAAVQAAPRPPAQLYPLPASRAELDKPANLAAVARSRFGRYRATSGDQTAPAAPGAFLAEQYVIHAVGELLAPDGAGEEN